MDHKMKHRLMQSDSEMGRAYRDQLMNMMFPKTEDDNVTSDDFDEDIDLNIDEYDLDDYDEWEEDEEDITIKNRKIATVYEDELQSFIDNYEVLEAENSGWNSIIFQFVQKHNLWNEFADHLKELKVEQESSNDIYYGDIDQILLDYIDGNKKN
jgi:hypothetical protein